MYLYIKEMYMYIYIYTHTYMHSISQWLNYESVAGVGL